MTWKLVDDGQTPKEVYNARIYFVAAMGGALFGYDNAFFGSVLALPAFKREFGLIGLSTPALNTLSSNIVITFQCGCLGATFLAYPMTEVLGRRKALAYFGVIFLVGAAIMLVGNLPSLYVGRFLTGVGVGPMTAVAPLYLSEIAPPALRGRFIGLFEIAYQVFALLGFWVSYGERFFLSQNIKDPHLLIRRFHPTGVATTVSGDKALQWRVPIALQIPLVGLLLFGLPFIHESPRHLCKKGETAKATKIVSALRNLPAEHDYVVREIGLINTELQAERELAKLPVDASIWTVIRRQLAECLRPGIRYRVSIGIITQMFGQFSGINGINYYSPRIFQSLGVRGTNTSLFATGVYGVVKTVTAIVSLLLLMDRIGRRASLLGGAVIMIIAQFYVGTYIKIAKPDPAGTSSIDGAGISALAFVYIYVIGFVGSFASVPYILSSEAAPINVRAISATLGAAAQWLGNLIITKATPYMITSLGFGTFYFFGSCVVLGSIYVWFFVPETRGLPMEELDVVFGMNLVHGRRDEEKADTASQEAKANEARE